jgi:4-amino-4-deoxy-L-arabinose transferase-like glycosyltransferase
MTIGTIPPQTKNVSRAVSRIVLLLLIALCLIFLLARFVHLESDFPYAIDNSSDLYTDEGWYNNSAITHTLTGEWLMPGDFNPILDLPVFQLIQAAVFQWAGMSLQTARLSVALSAVAICLLAFGLVARLEDAWTGFVVLLLLSTNFLLFAYSRLSILELPMTALILCSLWLAVSARGPRNAGLVAAVIVFTLAVLTKTSAVFALPSLMLLIASRQTSLRNGLICAGAAALGVLALVGAYYALAYHWFPDDLAYYYQEAFGPNEHPWTLVYFIKAMIPVVRNGVRMDVNFLIPLALAGVPILLICSGRARRSRLMLACVLWLGVAYLFFDIRGKLPLRYFIPLIPPFAMVVGYMLVRMIRAWRPRIWAWIPGMVLAGLIGVGIYRITNYVSDFSFTYMEMANDIKSRVAADGYAHPRISGNIAETLTLATGIPAVNYDFGPGDRMDRLARYCPQYYIMLGENQKILDQLAAAYAVEKISVYHVFHDYYQGKSVNFYRLQPLSAIGGCSADAS